MGFADKFKNIFNMSEEEFLDDIDVDDDDNEQDDYEEESPKEVRSNYGFKNQRSESSNSKVVDMRSSIPKAAASSKAYVVFKKLDKFEEVGAVADVLNEKRIVILNLETCPNDISIRIIDFLSGVAYANNGEIRRVAGRAYVITPYNIPLTGELLDEIGNRNNY